MAGWQSGYAADCNSVYAGSIPTPASILLYSGYAHIVRLVDARNLASIRITPFLIRVLDIKTVRCIPALNPRLNL